MVDAIDSKSIALCGCVSSSLTGGTKFFLFNSPSLLYLQAFESIKIISIVKKILRYRILKTKINPN